MKRRELKRPKKLELHRETLHQLEEMKLGEIVGGTYTGATDCNTKCNICIGGGM